MTMNRKFLEVLYIHRDVAARRLEEIGSQNTHCAELCERCDRTINSSEPAHAARLDEIRREAHMTGSLLDLYWETHNGDAK